ncbi:MAG TPA: helix-turn-helix domain-containing protein, partial [Gemmatimonadaceae bacterium]|nr:helix-turn-helix domain-containing protein [Gemmatimonadaceae bacterium]
LRERRDDLTLLIPHLLERIGKRRGRSLRLSPAALDALVAWDWPGNVRELENALEYATALCDGHTVQVAHLPPGISLESRPIPSPAPSPEAGFPNVAVGAHASMASEWAAPLGSTPAGLRAVTPSSAITVAMTLAEQDELLRIRAALERARYRRDEAAQMLGMSRTTLWRKMKQYRL